MKMMKNLGIIYQILPFLYSNSIFKKLGTNFSIEDIVKLYKKNLNLFDVVNGINEAWKRNYEQKKADLRIKTGRNA